MFPLRHNATPCVINSYIHMFVVYGARTFKVGQNRAFGIPDLINTLVFMPIAMPLCIMLLIVCGFVNCVQIECSPPKYINCMQAYTTLVYATLFMLPAHIYKLYGGLLHVGCCVCAPCVSCVCRATARTWLSSSVSEHCHRWSVSTWRAIAGRVHAVRPTLKY